MQDVLQQAREGALEQIPVFRYQQLYPPVVATLRSITGMEFQNYRTAKAWWDEHHENFEVQD